jgi:chromosome segregation protein
MSPARLRALRLVGFKSFADRTTVEFGPGISAVIGPNGSGKSNLADALRWSLGEQGRSLRTRRAEDLIFAGSSVRRAQGMADVTLVIDNGDRLLPVDYGEIELGRRLYRSGENEYLLNRQKIRLRDLVDLLDEANLADNAFLFIGQGMVDQALALRPEERRPLFEEAAGTRKHERRRRAAESELVEAEANLERVRDLVGELRPQARRLAAQAEQQTQRRDAGRDLATALVAVARERLGGAERETIEQRAALERAHREADEALAALRGAEEASQALTQGLADRAVAERELRAAVEAARGRVVEARLAGTRVAGDADGLRRDRVRLTDEQALLRGRLEAAARDQALPVAEPDDAADDGLRDAERRLADAVRALAEAREAGRSDEQRLRRLRGEREARLAEAGRIRQRAVEAARRLAEGEAAVAAAAGRSELAERSRDGAAAAAAASAAAEAAAERDGDGARADLAIAEARAREATAHEATARGELASLRGRAAALDQLLAIGRSDAHVARIRAAGGRAVTVGLEVEPSLRRAVEAVLGEVLAGHLVPPGAVAPLADVGGTLLLSEAAPVRPGRDREGQIAEARAAGVAEAAAAAGGGLLGSGLRRDPGGILGRLLAHAAWVPDLSRAVQLATTGVLGLGWSVATPAGEVVTHDGVVRLARSASLLERRAERADLEPAMEAAAVAADRAAEEARTAAGSLAVARRTADAARAALETARRTRRVADEAERSAARTAESALREAAWAASQLERLRSTASSAEAERAALDAEELAWARESASADAEQGDQVRAEIAAQEVQVGVLTRERDRWAATARASRDRLEADRERRRRADLRLAMDGGRNEELERDLERLVGAEADLATRRDAIAASLAAATVEESRLAANLRELELSGSDDRVRLIAAERTANEARERLRASESRARAVEVRMLEVRVQLDAAREGLLVELSAIGPEGLAALQGEWADPAGPRPPAFVPVASAHRPVPDADPAQALDADGIADGSLEDDRTAALEAALDAALGAWRLAEASGATAMGIPAPSSGRLTSLRRRYHELGAGNPYAAEELAELSVRLDALETQRSDLESAIRSTRELIARLSALITEQFRTTFAALEGAFARRFRQLFDGGEAQLSLTAPDDLASTGVEITARPPGKKRQPLAMLSGGERSLTAVALLLAMLEVRPVPFCVLDEVDAALDEANVGRFSAALRGLAESIQFIVITHNRGTIEAADALYGVTVGDDAVSRVISLRLGDGVAEAGAAGDRPTTEEQTSVAQPDPSMPPTAAAEPAA